MLNYCHGVKELRAIFCKESFFSSKLHRSSLCAEFQMLACLHILLLLSSFRVASRVLEDFSPEFVSLAPGASQSLGKNKSSSQELIKQKAYQNFHLRAIFPLSRPVLKRSWAQAITPEKRNLLLLLLFNLGTTSFSKKNYCSLGPPKARPA